MSTIPVQKRAPRTEENIDEAIEESFPASDPPSYSRTARSGSPPRGAKLKRVPCEDATPKPESDVRQDEEKSK